MSKFIKAAFAASLTLPLAGILAAAPASAFDYPAENDCTQPFGAITTQPGPVNGAYGIDNGPGDGDDEFHDDCTGGDGDFGKGRKRGPGPAAPTGDEYTLPIPAEAVEGDLFFCDGPFLNSTGPNDPDSPGGPAVAGGRGVDSLLFFSIDGSSGPGAGRVINDATGRPIGVRLTVDNMMDGFITCIDTKAPPRPTTGP